MLLGEREGVLGFALRALAEIGGKQDVLEFYFAPRFFCRDRADGENRDLGLAENFFGVRANQHFLYCASTVGTDDHQVDIKRLDGLFDCGPEISFPGDSLERNASELAGFQGLAEVLLNFSMLFLQHHCGIFGRDQRVAIQGDDMGKLNRRTVAPRE